MTEFLLLDFIIDTASVNSRTPELEAMTRARVEELAALHVQSENLRRQEFVPSALPLGEGATPSSTGGLQPLGDVVPHYASLTKAVPILVRRLFRNHLRQKGTWLNRVNQPTVIATVLIIYFHNLGYQPTGVFSRLGCFQQMTGITAAAILASLAAFPREVPSSFFFLNFFEFFLLCYFHLLLPEPMLILFFNRFICTERHSIQGDFKRKLRSLVLFVVVYGERDSSCHFRVNALRHPHHLCDWVPENFH